MRMVHLKELTITKDPSFYQYTDFKELDTFTTSELTIALRILRQEQRRLQDKTSVRGRLYERSGADPIDKKNLQQVEKYRDQVEVLLAEKQGYIPSNLTDKAIDKIISEYKKTYQKLAKKGKLKLK